MKTKTLLAGLTLALLATGACTAANTNNANTTANTNANSNANSNASNTAAAPANTSAANANAASQTAPAATEGKQDFTLVNATGVEIHNVHISPHDSNDWEEDILGQDTLPDGQKVDIKFKRDETAAMWDLRVQDKEGNAIEWENLNLLKISKVTLHYKDGKATAEVE